MSDAFRVDPEALADAVQRMADFQRYAESMITEIDSLVSNCTRRGRVRRRRRTRKRINIGPAAKR